MSFMLLPVSLDTKSHEDYVKQAQETMHTQQTYGTAEEPRLKNSQFYKTKTE